MMMLIVELCALLEEREREKLSYLLERIVTLDYCALYKYSYLLTYFLEHTLRLKKLANILVVSRASKHISDRVLSRYKAKYGNAEIAHKAPTIAILPTCMVRCLSVLVTSLNSTETSER